MLACAYIKEAGLRIDLCWSGRYTGHSQLLWLLQAAPCSAGDSAGYLRRSSASDDVVVVSALRTAVTKVLFCCCP